MNAHIETLLLNETMIVTTKLEAEVHRIPEPFTSAFLFGRHFRGRYWPHRKRYEMQWKISYRAFIYCIHGRCREHALALTHSEFAKKS